MHLRTTKRPLTFHYPEKHTLVLFATRHTFDISLADCGELLLAPPSEQRLGNKPLRSRACVLPRVCVRVFGGIPACRHSVDSSQVVLALSGPLFFTERRSDFFRVNRKNSQTDTFANTARNTMSDTSPATLVGTQHLGHTNLIRIVFM